MSELILAIAAILTALLAVAKWIDGRAKKRTDAVAKRVESVMSLLVRRLTSQMAAAGEKDPHGCLTLDFATPNGTRLRVPIPRFEKIEVWEGVWMSQQLGAPADASLLLLECPSLSALPDHLHWESVEEATVISGSMTDLKTGRIFHAGESWTIPSGEVHSASFHRAVVLLKIKPPLPTAAQAPVQLDGFEDVLNHLA